MGAARSTTKACGPTVSGLPAETRSAVPGRVWRQNVSSSTHQERGLWTTGTVKVTGSDVCAAERDEPAGECGQVDVGAVPVDPGDRVVLAVGVVAATFGTAEFVTGENPRYAAGEKQCGEECA